MAISVAQFHWLDYVIFAATLFISIAIGLYYAIRGGGSKTTAEYLQGGRKMPVIPTSLSLLVSFQSGILILGISSEMYMKGTNYVWYLIGILIGLPLASMIYLPIFYKLKLTSAYEYLELRFRSKLIRLIGSFLFIGSTVMYMAIVLYAPATALNQVSGVHLETLIILSGVACTFYTTLGGLKAVVWTDAFQAVVMYAGLIAVIVQGTLNVGGPKEVWIKAWEGGRIITDFNPNPFSYMNFWIVVVGTAFGWMSVYGTSQTAIQRYTSLQTLKQAQVSLLLVVPGMFTLFPLVVIAGLVMFAYYSECDPLDAKLVANRDQLLPYFVVDILGHLIGMPGVFLACLYSGTLSTVSSGLNSLAAVVWEDILKDTVGKRLSERQATNVNRAMACAFGVISIAFACVAKFFGGVFQAAMTVLSMLGGPLSGLFLFGMLFPWANMLGALCGVIVSSGIMAWICIGAQLLKPYRKSLPRKISGCSNATLQAAGLITSFINTTNSSSLLNDVNNNGLFLNLNSTESNEDLELTGYQYIYKLSYKMYGLTAIILVFIVGVPISLLTRGCKLPDRDKDYIWPGVRHFCGCWISDRFATLLKYSEREAYESDQEKSLKNQVKGHHKRSNIDIVRQVYAEPENYENYKAMKEQAFTDTLELEPLMDSRHQSLNDDYYITNTARISENYS